MRIWTSCLATAVFLAPGPLLAQDVDNSTHQAIAIPYQPEVGGVWRVEVTRRRATSQNGAATVTEADISARFTIVTATDYGFDAIWETLSISTSDGAVAEGEVHPSLLIGVPIALEVGFDGAPRAFKDWRGLLAAVTPTIDATSNEQSREYAHSLIESWGPELGASVLMQELGILAICQHTEFVIGARVEFGSEIPNHVGGPPFTALNAYELASVDDQTGVAEMLYSRTLDPESVTASMKVAVEAIAANTGRDLSETMREWDGVTMTNDSTAECLVDRPSGMTTNVAYRVHVTAGPGVEYEDSRLIRVTSEQQRAQ